MPTGAGEVRKVLNVLPNDSGTIAAASSIEASSLADRLWVSVSKKTGFRRLHIIGKCWYTAALREFPSNEDGAQFDARCERCWGVVHVGTMAKKLEIESNASVDSSDESSSDE